jgi:hypothetical protein
VKARVVQLVKLFPYFMECLNEHPRVPILSYIRVHVNLSYIFQIHFNIIPYYSYISRILHDKRRTRNMHVYCDS